jgi:hypothetical protein
MGRHSHRSTNSRKEAGVPKRAAALRGENALLSAVLLSYNVMNLHFHMISFLYSIAGLAFERATIGLNHNTVG